MALPGCCAKNAFSPKLLNSISVELRDGKYCTGALFLLCIPSSGSVAPIHLLVVAFYISTPGSVGLACCILVVFPWGEEGHTTLVTCWDTSRRLHDVLPAPINLWDDLHYAVTNGPLRSAGRGPGTELSWFYLMLVERRHDSSTSFSRVGTYVGYYI
jgi:hypothetical protein